jgi:glycosyltransferase involved in cell wall biosynthesis
MIDSAAPDFANSPSSERRAEFGYAAAEPAAEPRVSLITVVHDQASALATTARSVFGQSFQHWEWLIVHDGVSDTAACAELTRLRGLDSRVRVVEDVQRRGAAGARNAGIQLAHGALIGQLDAGDVLEPTAIEKWTWFLESHTNLSFVGAHRTRLTAESSASDKGIAAWPPDLDDQLGVSSGLVRADVYGATGGYRDGPTPAWMDWEFRLRCAAAGYWGGTVPEMLSRHLDNPERQPLDDLRNQYQDLWQQPVPPVVQQVTDWPAACLQENVPFANVLGKERPRLLLIGPWLTVGGADMFNLDLTRFAQRHGWDVTIATTLWGKADWISDFERLTSDLFVLPRFLRPEDFPRFFRYLIVSRQIDAVLITHSEFGYTLLPYIRRHCADVALIDVSHIETEGWRGGGYPGLAVASQPLLDLNIVTTAHLKQWMVDHEAEAARISVCHTNVDVAEWCPDADTRTKVRADLRIDDVQPVLLYAARICPQKQPLVFARTLSELRQRGYQVTALVVGDGPDLPELEAFLVRENLTSSVRLLGTVSTGALKQLMQAADIFFLPSEWEGISIAVYDAMACGLAVVSADVGGQSELVVPDCGVLVERSTPELEVQHYARVLGELIDHPERRALLGANARRRVSACFRLDQMGEHLAEALQQALTLHARQPRVVPSAAESTLGALRAIDGATYETKLLGVEGGKAWLAEQSTRWQGVAHQQNETLAEMRQWVSNLEEANSWLTEQATAWEKATHEQELTVQELAKTVREQQRAFQESQAWVSSLREANASLREQGAAWEKVAQEQAQQIQESSKAQMSYQPTQHRNGVDRIPRHWAAVLLRRLSSWVEVRH